MPSPELRMFVDTKASTAVSTASDASSCAVPSSAAMRRCQAPSTAASHPAPLPASAGGVACVRDSRVRYSLTDSSVPACPRRVSTARPAQLPSKRACKVVHPVHAPQVCGARAGGALRNLRLVRPGVRAADGGFAQRICGDALRKNSGSEPATRRTHARHAPFQCSNEPTARVPVPRRAPSVSPAPQSEAKKPVSVEGGGAQSPLSRGAPLAHRLHPGQRAAPQALPLG